MDNSLSHVITAGKTDDGEGRELYALAIMKQVENGQWVRDEILHMHAFSATTAKLAYFASLPPHIAKRRMIISCGRSIGAQSQDDHGDFITI